MSYAVNKKRIQVQKQLWNRLGFQLKVWSAIELGDQLYRQLSYELWSQLRVQLGIQLEHELDGELKGWFLGGQ
jgi:hypothetical protein